MEKLIRQRSWPVLFAVAALAACSSERASTTSTATSAKTANAANAPRSNAPIGTATMKADGTIVLMLRADDEVVRGDAMFEYPRGHKEYAEILKHLGGLKPGESKPVPPWPDRGRNKP